MDCSSMKVGIMCALLTDFSRGLVQGLEYNKFSISGFPAGSVVKNLLTSAGNIGQSLIQVDPTCHGAAKPMHHKY